MRELTTTLELKAHKGKLADRLLLEGLRPTRAAHDAGVPFDHVLFAPELFVDGCQPLLDSLKAAGVACHHIERKEFSKISYKAEGIACVVRFAGSTLDDVLRSPRVVVLDALSDPGNIGAVVRSANAWRASVAVVDTGDKLYHPKSLRAGMGALFHTATCPTDRATITKRLAGKSIIALVPDGDPLDRVPFDAELALVIGNERRGVHPDWLAVATARVAIPMTGMVDSLNAATAAAILLWEAFRRER
ncbi:MAG: RNA methyltransferase [Kofleriaceae bacterium]